MDCRDGPRVVGGAQALVRSFPVPVLVLVAVSRGQKTGRAKGAEPAPHGRCEWRRGQRTVGRDGRWRVNSGPDGVRAATGCSSARTRPWALVGVDGRQACGAGRCWRGLLEVGYYVRRGSGPQLASGQSASQMSEPKQVALGCGRLGRRASAGCTAPVERRTPTSAREHGVASAVRCSGVPPALTAGESDRTQRAASSTPHAAGTSTSTSTSTGGRQARST